MKERAIAQRTIDRQIQINLAFNHDKTFKHHLRKTKTDFRSLKHFLLVQATQIQFLLLLDRVTRKTSSDVLNLRISSLTCRLLHAKLLIDSIGKTLISLFIL